MSTNGPETVVASNGPETVVASNTIYKLSLIVSFPVDLGEELMKSSWSWSLQALTQHTLTHWGFQLVKPCRSATFMGKEQFWLQAEAWRPHHVSNNIIRNTIRLHSGMGLRLDEFNLGQDWIKFKLNQVKINSFEVSSFQMSLWELSSHWFRQSHWLSSKFPQIYYCLPGT